MELTNSTVNNDVTF